MEDCNMLVADCIVICCCSQCLILQMVIFVLLKLPCKLIRKTKGYAKKKLGRGRKGRTRTERVKGGFHDEAVEIHRSSIRIEILEGLACTGGEGHGFRCCIEEAEKVLEELSEKGEFAFGSFWGR
ncbi:hypothetical protein QUC31_013388 [Theobroma cacao]|uniref:Uncharacterized protein n=2 Tax=Theobroma cacao TaxID=3641 RepID=A0A061EC66_THECC|nr:PREDICTED: uncharacterized protein LOC18610576 [Theobroma cacao]EOY02198.1 Uncharacterized protein TCM_011903 [Theobroma cacao]